MKNNPKHGDKRINANEETEVYEGTSEKWIPLIDFEEEERLHKNEMNIQRGIAQENECFDEELNQ